MPHQTLMNVPRPQYVVHRINIMCRLLCCCRATPVVRWSVMKQVTGCCTELSAGARVEVARLREDLQFTLERQRT